MKLGVGVSSISLSLSAIAFHTSLGGNCNLSLCRHMLIDYEYFSLYLL